MDRETLASLLRDTHDADPAVRRHAARELCPCEIKVNDGQVWDRILELCGDPDVSVRRSVLHTMIDGSPREHGPHQPGRALEICSPGRDTTPRRGEASA